MRIFLLSILLLLQGILLPAQQNELLPFTIEGYIQADTGTVKLQLLHDKDYYPKGVEEMLATVRKGKFAFSGTIPYPQGVTLSYGTGYYSSLFVIEPGTQTVNCSIDAPGEVPEVTNRAMEEYEREYTKAFQEVRLKSRLHREKRDSLHQLYQKKIPALLEVELAEELKGLYLASDGVRLQYVSAHPESYVAFWNFIYLFSGFGYESIFEAVISQFSDSLKATHAGQVLSKKLAVAGKLDYGKPFPAVAAVDPQNSSLDYASFSNNQYTFVEFWFSNCHPCIAQFPHLRETYEKYKDKGFEIVGISTDREKYEQNWKNAIEKYQLSWSQYWDKDGVEASKLSINKFPTNFLLDRQGNIIKKDLKPAELAHFLDKNLEKNVEENIH